jgi:hypothetical protein
LIGLFKKIQLNSELFAAAFGIGQTSEEWQSQDRIHCQVLFLVSFEFQLSEGAWTSATGSFFIGRKNLKTES